MDSCNVASWVSICRRLGLSAGCVSYLTAVQDAETITATEAARAAADAAVAVAEGQYRAGVGTIVAVVTAQANAAQAEVNAVTAVYTYQTGLATLRHAQGIPVAGGGSQ